MHRLTIAAVSGLAALALAAPGASAAADRAVSVTHEAPKATWSGATASGLNTSYFLDGTATTGACGKDQQTYCDSTLVKIDSLVDKGAKLTVRMDGFTPVSDFDLRVYQSNDKGERLTYLGSPTGDVAAGSPAGSSDPRHTGPGDFESKEATSVKTGQYYLVDVVYFAVANDKYNGTVTVTKTLPNPAPAPAPAGLR